MKNYKKLLSVALAGCMGLSFSSCRDDWSGTNTDEKTIDSATPVQLLATAEVAMYPFGYGTWFSGAPGYFASTQMGGFTGSYGEGRCMTSPGGSDCTVRILRYVSAMDYELGRMDEEEAAKYEAYRQAVKVLSIFCGIQDTDVSGDIPYNEGGRGLHGGPLTPAYDRVEDLYTQWNNELKSAVQVFKNPPVAPLQNASQDIAFGADWNKWAKFASSLRVKLATRLIHRDLARAKSIVAEAFADGVMTNADDDMLYHKADRRANTSAGGIDPGELAFGSGNTTITYWGGAPSEKVMNFMFKNRDPRVRFHYTKTNWSAKILDFYLQHGYKNIVPSFILERAEIEPDGANFKFVKWKDEFGGDLWARYIGVPDKFDASNSRDPEMLAYFHFSATPEDHGHQIEVGDGKYSYRPYSTMIEKMIMTNADYTAPRAPGEEASQSDYNTDTPRYDLYMSAAEVNFYLAEFATYGGVSGLGSAADYFKKAVQQSVEVWDKMANLNHVQYYHETYGYSPDDVSIALREGEVAALLAKPDYQLTGNKADDLEKIFLNMEIHFMFDPVNHFVTGRRSGIPKFGSNLIARVDYTANSYPVTLVGRRPNFGAISPTDQMAEILKEVYNRQGFTISITDLRSGLLNSERLWQDVGAPQWGAGPNVGI